MRSGRIIGLVLCAAALAGIGGCGGGGYGSDNTPTGTGNPPPPPTNTVTVKSSSFSPSTITVARGATVRWTWDSCTTSGGDIYGNGGTQTCVAHNVTFDGANASATQETGNWSRAFPDAGTFNYQCTIHGAAMSGKVVVQ